MTIVGPDAGGSGQLKIRWTKRGTKTTWTGEIGAADFGAMLRSLKERSDADRKAA